MRTGEDAIVVERAESALVVRSAETDAAAVGYAAALPAEAERTTVVVDASAAGALQALDDRLVARLRDLLYAEPPRRWEMRLVAARTGRPGSSGEPPLAARLADRLGMGVVAPDGELIALRGGELFSAGPGAGWLGFGRAVHPEWTGPRYPAPAWQSALPRELRSPKPRPLSRLRGRASSVTVTAIPAGVWVRKAGTPPMPLVDLGFGVPVEPARPIVLVGAPGEQPPAVAELAAFLECLPPAVRDIAVLVPYGQHPEACAALAQSLANRLNGLVRAYHALPHYAADGTRKFAVFNERATPDRLTETPEDAYLPSRATPRAREDDEDLYGDPVVFDTLLESPTPPAPAPDPALTTGPRSTQPGSLGGTASVTVDAQGRLRPATPTNPRPAEPRPARTNAGGGEKGHPTTPATHAPTLDPSNREVANHGAASHEAVGYGVVGREAGHGVAGREAVGGGAADQDTTGHDTAGREATDSGAADQYTADRYTAGQEVGAGPSVFRTTASTVLPQTRPSARVVAPPEQAAIPAEAVLPEPAPRPVASDDGSNTADPADRPVRGDERAVTDAPPPTPVHDTAFAADPGGSRADMPEATGATARGHEPWTIRADVRPVSGERTSAPLAGEGASPTGPLSSAVPPQAPAPVPADDAPTAPRIPQRRDYDRLWLAKRVSTPQERQAFRASLGWRYDAAARSVARLLAEHPGLRSAGPPDEVLMTDLAAVRVFAGRDQAATVESFRLGEDDADRAFAACVAGGLRRLPSFQGVVVRGGPPDPGAADLYREGEDLVEAAPLIALDDLGAQVPGGLEILIWSATARRLTGFAENRRIREVAFLPGTVFRVLAVDPPSAAAVRRVLLTEVPPAKAGRTHTEWADRVRARLVEAAESRPATPSAENGESDDRFAALPGDPAFDELRSRP
ncbi:hypothetical protein [Actinoallomurus iriomotensis]|uniref:Uncharacterized protein n=1 Tax=Actinoallomurus iriomotensis TaxID=478107 RepID=A0A9W6VK53_9ACTN|nr:hypothetical protein [Actinoallomurus iriomotensis]GLY74858.1 hypothetical protein Airi01_031250 [Actinoallomurus iriomotensis]